MQTLIMFIFDRSGSMDVCRDAVISGYNEFVQDQQKKTTKGTPFIEGAETTMSLTFFDTTCERVFHDQPISSVKKLTRGSYSPNGSTALYDAVVETIKSVKVVPGQRVLCVIQTDGEENASRRYRQRDVADLIKAQTAEGNWTFVFLGANQDAWAVAQKLNIPQGNTMSYVGDAAGTTTMFASTRQIAREYLGSPAMATTSFFTDLSTLVPKEVRTELVDLRSQVKVWQVEKEHEIKPFVEFHTGVPYSPGTAYYQLTKKETIQPNKDILLMEKQGKAVYGGTEARVLLGFPKGVNARVTPGNHANWDIFVQSKSTNRKLVRGTKLIYKP